MSKVNNDNATRSAFEKTDCDLRIIFDELEGQVASYRKALNDICKGLGLTDGTGLPEMGEIICAEIDKRIMPPGMEWPKVDGEPVDFTTGYTPSLGVLEAVEIYKNGACTVMSHGGIVANVDDIHIEKPYPRGVDGLPIKKGETTYGIGRSKHEFIVLEPHDSNPDVGERFSVKCYDKDDEEVCWCDPNLLTHTKIEPPDSWERLEEDAENLRQTIAEKFGDYIFDGSGNDSVQTRLIDIVRRAKALAEE